MPTSFPLTFSYTDRVPPFLVNIRHNPSSPASSALNGNANVDASADSGVPVVHWKPLFKITYLELEQVYSFDSARSSLLYLLLVGTFFC